MCELLLFHLVDSVVTQETTIGMCIVARQNRRVYYFMTTAPTQIAYRILPPTSHALMTNFCLIKLHRPYLNDRECVICMLYRDSYWLYVICPWKNVFIIIFSFLSSDIHSSFLSEVAFVSFSLKNEWMNEWMMLLVMCELVLFHLVDAVFTQPTAIGMAPTSLVARQNGWVYFRWNRVVVMHCTVWIKWNMILVALAPRLLHGFVSIFRWQEVEDGKIWDFSGLTSPSNKMLRFSFIVSGNRLLVPVVSVRSETHGHTKQKLIMNIPCRTDGWTYQHLMHPTVRWPQNSVYHNGSTVLRCWSQVTASQINSA